MPYNMWFVTTAVQGSPAAEWIELVSVFRKGAKAKLEAGTQEDWQRIHVKGPDDWWWFDVEQYSVTSAAERWAGQLEFFQSWLAVVKPEGNARWVEEYLQKVWTVYTFECSTSCSEENMDLVDEMVRKLRETPESGLLYAELEGWKNQLGAHITWEFSEQVRGACLMAVHRPGRWAYFRMELGDPEQRLAFQVGEVPAGVEFKEYAD